MIILAQDQNTGRFTIYKVFISHLKSADLIFFLCKQQYQAQDNVVYEFRHRLLWYTYRISSRWPVSVYLGPKRAHLRILMLKIQSTCLSTAVRSRFCLQLAPHQICFNLFSEFALTRSPWRPKWFSINYVQIVRCAKITDSRNFCILLQYGWMLHISLCGNQLGHNGALQRLSRSRGWFLRHFVLERLSEARIVTVNWTYFSWLIDNLASWRLILTMIDIVDWIANSIVSIINLMSSFVNMMW